MIVHGLLGSARNWHARAKVLGQSYFVVVTDLRNHGESPHSDEMSYPAMLADLIELLDRLLIAKTHVIGHSMGGKCAMGLALTQAKRIRSLVVVDMAPRRYEHGLDAFIGALQDTDLERARSRAEIEKRLQVRIPDRATRLFLLTNLEKQEGGFRWKPNLPVLLHAYAAISESVDNVFSGAHPFSGKALFLRGENSNYIQDQDRNDIRRLFPSAHVVTVKKASHWIHSDQPHVFDDIVKSFLKNRVAT